MSSTEPHSVNLKDIELTWDTATKIVIHFVQKAQSKSAFKLQEAGILFRAVNFFSGEEKELTESQSLKLLLNGVHVGQSHGCFTLEEAGILQNKFIPFLETELKSRSEKPKVKEI